MARLLVLAFLVCSSLSHALSWPTHDPQRAATDVYLPDDFSPKQTYPVVLLLHGYAGTSSIIDTYFGLSALVTARQFILIVPNGKTDSSGLQFWNATDGCCNFDHAPVDDVAFLRSVLRTARAKFHVSSIAVAGHSNGGFMAYRLACEMADQISTVVSFAGAVASRAASCQPKRPVSILEIHALDDDTISWGSGVASPGLQPHPSVTQTIVSWLVHDQCFKPPTHGPHLDLTTTIPGPDTTVKTWSCANDTSVSLWTIKAYSSALHTPHTPLLTDEFTERVADYLLVR